MNASTHRSERYQLYATIGSPYALKLRSLMRFKRLPFDWAPATIDWLPTSLPKAPASAAASERLRSLQPLRFVPAVLFPSDQVIRDESTAIAHALEAVSPQQPIVPLDPGIAFLSNLVEDMSDEWLVKIAFLYRWSNEEDAELKSRIVTGELLGGGYEQSVFDEAARFFAARQQSRMPLVGSTDGNQSIIEATFTRLLRAIDALPTSSSFLFGSSPLLGDFGLYGQLQSLATDPTPSARMRRDAPNVFLYLQLLEDASGIDAAAKFDQRLGRGAIDILRIAADIYVPYLLANEQALSTGAHSLRLEVTDGAYSAAPFKYHLKCLQKLRNEYALLSAATRTWIGDIADFSRLFFQ